MSIRQRTRRACQSCRRRKRRCDGGQPCQACTDFDYDCFYAEPTERSGTVQQGPDVTADPSSSQNVAGGRRDSAGGNISATQPRFNVEHDQDKLLEPNKRRFYDANSAISFPRVLSMSLGSATAPRIHSFAYNIGITPEIFLQVPDRRLASFPDIDLAERLARRYLDVVNPVFEVVEAATFLPAFRLLWSNDSIPRPFEMLAAFVVLLGSFFTVPSQFHLYKDLLQYTQDFLDRSDFRNAPSLLHIEHLQAWVLRTIYARCTTRPNIAWLSSSITLHIAESLGLHREYDSVGRLGISETRENLHDTEGRRRSFWLAWMLNRMISFEIGRSPTLINEINIRLPSEGLNTGCTRAIQTYMMLYPEGGHAHTTDVQGCLDTIASSMPAGGTEQPVLVLIKADMALGLYREMHKLNVQSLEKSGQRFVKILRPAYVAAQALLEDIQPWWWVASVPFQSVCSALSVGKSSMIQVLPEAMQVLHATNQRFGTKMTNEADQTARAMVRAALNAKNEDTTILSSILSSTTIWEGIEEGVSQEGIGSLDFWNSEY